MPVRTSVQKPKLFGEKNSFEVSEKQRYTLDNIREAELKIPGPLKKGKFTLNSLAVLRRRYLKKDKDGKPIEEPEDMFARVAETIAKADFMYGKTRQEAEQTAKKFYDLMINFDFLPNSPTLMNAGRDMGQLSACFVLPIEDSMTGIFETLKQTALIHQSGGGTGFSFSRLRPSGSMVKTTHGIASGPVSFMKIYNASTEEVKQGGTRRGANMGILRIDHPDIIEFIRCKENHTQINNFNISIAVTNKFMDALGKNQNYNLYDPHTKQKVGELSAREVFNLMVRNAWLNGDPGVVFIDRINETNPTRHMSEIEATNPCGEQPLPPYGSCNLGSINLGNFVVDGGLDWDRLGKVTRGCVHFLDNVIDMNKFPIEEIAQQNRSDRRIGLGVMGFADMLIKLKIPYNSEKGFEIGEKVMKFIHEKGHDESEKIGQERGNFPFFIGSYYEKEGKKYMRNSTVDTVAPTGTIAMIADCSSGIEPLYSIVFTKTVMDGTALAYIHPEFEKIAKQEGWYSDDLMKKISEHASVKGVDGVPEKWQKIFISAHDVAPKEHVRMQAAFQKYIDAAVSKTVNFPNEATEKDVERVYELAYKSGCKGITVYRDGSREAQVLSTDRTAKTREGTETQIVMPGPRPRPDIMQGTTYKMNTGYGKLYVTINDDENGEAFEVFAAIGKAGGFFGAMAEAICRLISLGLRSGIRSEEVIKEIKGIRGPDPVWSEGSLVLSLPDAIGQVMERHISRHKKQLAFEYKVKEQIKPILSIKESGESIENKMSLADLGIIPTCPDCGSPLEISEGCLKCRVCGYSKCS